MMRQRTKLLGRIALFAVFATLGLGYGWQRWEGENERRGRLAYAAAQGDMSTVRALLDAGVRPDAKIFHYYSALEGAAGHGHVDIVRLLLDRGCDPNEGLLPAARTGRDDVLALLLAKGAKVQGNAGASVLGHAVQSHNLAAVNLLLKNGVDINAIDDEHETALQHAASGDSWDMFQALLQQGADINARSSGGETMLMIAARGDSVGSRRICEYLIHHGADVNARDDDGQNALIWSVRLQRDSQPQSGRMPAILETLLQSGADVNARDKQGRTALRYAAEFRNGKAKALLTRWHAQF